MPVPRRPGLPPQFRPSAPQGAPTTPLPLVATVGTSGLTPTAVTLVGSINPQGVTTPWGTGNLVPNPSFEHDTSGGSPASWNATGSSSAYWNPGATLTVVGSQAYVGTQALQIVTTSGAAYEGPSVALTGSFLAGIPYTFSVYLKGTTGSEVLTLNLGNIGGTSFIQASASLTTAWKQFTATWTPASNTNGAVVGVFTSTAAADTFYMDAAMVTQTATAVTYFDGDTAGHLWSGAAGQSSSQANGVLAWFAYGTTPQFGSTTTPMWFSTASFPLTVTAYVSGLTTGSTYYYAVVCAAAGGTVTAAPLSFTPNVQPAVTNASNPIVSQATPAVTTPHYSWPFTITNSGAQVVEQDSTGEIVACVNAIAACQIGQCPELPTFGIPDLTFLTAPMDTSSLLQAVQTWEPRAQPSTVVSAMDQIGAGWNVQLTDTFTQSSGQ